MSQTSSTLSTQIKVLLFGSQALTFNNESFQALRKILTEPPNATHWALEVLQELPKYWDSLAKLIPSIRQFSGDEKLRELIELLHTDSVPDSSFPFPNIILTPLEVILQLIQYERLLQLNLRNDKEKIDKILPPDVTVIGLCTGALSAAAASLSATKSEFFQNAAVAIRLAMLIGTIVDAEDISRGPHREATSFSVSWISKESEAKLHDALASYTDTYISVLFDDQRVTVTTTKDLLPSIEQALKSIGCSISPIKLQGRFHFQGYKDHLALLCELCETETGLCFLSLKDSILPLQLPRTTTDDIPEQEKLHVQVLRSILMEQASWYKIFDHVQSTRLKHNTDMIACFGSENSIPPSLRSKISPQLIVASESDLPESVTSSPLLSSRDDDTGTSSPLLSSRDDDRDRAFPDRRVAVIGMSCMVPGARDLGEFITLLSEGKSQHIEVPADRFDFETPWRQSDHKRKWYGNFLQDYDSFDHKFFKKSPREMASTDPQHRLVLQAAYQALEQAGYVYKPPSDKHIGCYVGAGLVDYENNIACYPANAYSATGNLKSFSAGRISHWFGWTGPSLTLDTACSSSAVAVHQACRAILYDECSAALATGVNVMTSPQWFQNLAGASFLSPTGQCKPFDIDADGYCRGEAVGAVFLKKYTAAVADKDHIIGVIAATEVYQNQNCTPITVPNAVSLSDLFTNTVRQANLEPRQISVVEAHGTGTPVGDPAEYDGIRQIFGTKRPTALSLGSVKGLVGHSESASGMIALIKILLMVHGGFIPPQPSFYKLNPSINKSDQIEIPRELRPWQENFRAALINNYGASGSNASLVITQAPLISDAAKIESHSAVAEVRYPFWFCGLDHESLRRYAARFRQFLKNEGNELSLADLSFHVARQSNRNLDHAVIFACKSLSELDENLAAVEQERNTPACKIITRKPPRPVILCFGGQISTYVGLDRGLYNDVTILRHHLDQCNAFYISFGGPGIYPDIFKTTPIEDIIQLQTMLFAMQYASARTWIDCGITPVELVGHSFGELTSLCVSGVLSLPDAIKMVVGRARLIRSHWGSDNGLMVAVEGDLSIVEDALNQSNQSIKSDNHASIACFNGPRAFTIAGSTEGVEAFMNLVGKGHFASSIKTKRLDVTNAFHSTLVDPLKNDLTTVGQQLSFYKPTIPLQEATESESFPRHRLRGGFLAEHMRSPVYFNHAVQRLAKKYPSAVWLEAGSNSTITIMASRALGSASQSSYFQSVNISSGSSPKSFVDHFTSLWREGVNVNFWLHHVHQAFSYKSLLLPPYQFERSRHWMDLKRPLKPDFDQKASSDHVQEPIKGLWSFHRFQGQNQRDVRFRVNVESEEFQDYLQGHIVVDTTPLCSSVLQLQIAVDALMSLRPEFQNGTFQPELHGLESHSPMCQDMTKSVWLDATPIDDSGLIWNFKINSDGERAPLLYVSGRISFQKTNEARKQAQIEKYQRLVGGTRLQRLMVEGDADQIMQGRAIYQSFASIVRYSAIYKGLKKIAGKNLESAGYVIRPQDLQKSHISTGLFDSFCQVAGIFINCMMERPDAETTLYISDRIEQWVRSPRFQPTGSWPDSFDVFASHQRNSDKEITSDIFVFDPRDGALLEVILGIHYQLVPIEGMRKVLRRVSRSPPSGQSAGKYTEPLEKSVPAPAPVLPITTSLSEAPLRNNQKKLQESQDLANKIRDILCNLSGLEPEVIKEDTQLGDVGIDSLMGMELAREIEDTLQCTLSISELNDVTDFKGLLRCIQNALGEGKEGEEDKESLPERQIVNGHRTSQDEHPAPNGVDPAPNGAAHTIRSPLINGTAQKYQYSTSPSPPTEICLARSLILETFATTKQATDEFMTTCRLATYVKQVLPTSTELCIILILDAFDELGCSIRSIAPGQTLVKVPHLARHRQFVDFIYDLLQKARIIDIDNVGMKRTKMEAPQKSAERLLAELIRDSPDFAYDHQLTFLVGKRLAECLIGSADGLQIIFGSPEGKEVVSGMYRQSPINLAWIKQMQSFLRIILSQIPDGNRTISVMEVGAGTGGTTAAMAELFSSLQVQVVYTVTDLSPSLVAGLRKRFKHYPFMEFKVFDIEKEAPLDMIQSQHIIIATNCVHATHSLEYTTTNIHKLLRPDGFLMMLEMTETLPWIDLVFGLVEGWWLFNDGRKHALAPPDVWKSTLQQVGFGAIDWTDGHLPETNIQRIILAMASGPTYDHVSLSDPLPTENVFADYTARQAAVDSYVAQFTKDFHFKPHTLPSSLQPCPKISVLVTGATGSLGSHLVAHLARLPTVSTIYCLNRLRGGSPRKRQQQSFDSRGIHLDMQSWAKLRILQTDASKSRLGLKQSEYDELTDHVTDIVHNAWPMSLSRSIQAFETQFQIMANLLRLACDISYNKPTMGKVAFQFISSIATVGEYPRRTGKTRALEERMTVDMGLSTGYSDAKLVCERMLEDTLGKHVSRFRAMAVRIGQIAGSKDSGYWNPVEHLAFLLKSCQTLGAMPALKGDLSWCPVNDVAGTLVNLLEQEDPFPIYHIENPHRQPWADMIATLADCLDAPTLIPFDEWVRRVRSLPWVSSTDNPAFLIIDFLEEHFVRMSCGSLVLDTSHTQAHSATLAATGPVDTGLVRKYVSKWKELGFLRQ